MDCELIISSRYIDVAASFPSHLSTAGDIYKRDPGSCPNLTHPLGERLLHAYSVVVSVLPAMPALSVLFLYASTDLLISVRFRREILG